MLFTFRNQFPLKRMEIGWDILSEYSNTEVCTRIAYNIMCMDNYNNTYVARCNKGICINLPCGQIISYCVAIVMLLLVIILLCRRKKSFNIGTNLRDRVKLYTRTKFDLAR